MSSYDQNWIEKLPPARKGDWDGKYLKLAIDSPVTFDGGKPSLVVAGSLVQIVGKTSVQRLNGWDRAPLPEDCWNDPSLQLLDVKWLCTHCEAPHRELYPQWWIDKRHVIFVEEDPAGQPFTKPKVSTNDDGGWVDKLPPARKGDWDSRYLRLNANSTITHGWQEKTPSLLIAGSIVQIIRRTSVKQTSHGSLPVPPECKGQPDAKLFDVKWLCPHCGTPHRELLPQTWIDDRKAVFVERDPLAMAA